MFCQLTLGQKIIKFEEYLGTGGRNTGELKAKGDIVVTLDDDVSGLSERLIAAVILELSFPDIGAVAFRKQAFLDADVYAGYFFISHKELDLAIRIMDWATGLFALCGSRLFIRTDRMRERAGDVITSIGET